MNPLKSFDLECLLRTPYVEPDLGFDISASGAEVAFSWNKSGTWEIYIRSLHSEKTTTYPVTSGPGAKFAPRWRPGTYQLAYALDLDGGENYDLYLCDLKSGTHQNLTPDSPFAISPEYCWSPDGESIAFTANRDGNFDTYILTLKNRSIRKIFASPQQDWEVAWSPTGDNLAVVSEAEGQGQWITIVPVTSDAPPWKITQEGIPLDARHPCWSHDGKQLLFVSNQMGYAQIAQLQIESAEITWITNGRGEKDQPHLHSSGVLVYVTHHGPTCEITIQPSWGSNPIRRRIAPGVVYHPKFSPSDTCLVFIFDNPQHPCDLWTLTLPNGDFRQLTQSSDEMEELVPMVIPEEVVYPSLDKTLVPALLYSPPKDQKPAQHQPRDVLPPAIIYIHGGPNWLAQITWDPLIKYMVSLGWVVLAPNYRGSTGYGKDWQWANRFDLGGVDTEDIAAGWDYLVSNRIADPLKIALTGRSWGGYLTMTCLTQYPDRWAAGSAVVPFLNWFTAHENSRQDLQHWDLENFGDPIKNRELWYKRSPFFFLDQIMSPVQLICGANDIRCPASESLAAYERLTALGKDCEYILYPDEGHSFLQIKNVIQSKKQQVAFLSKYLDNDRKGKSVC